jgi:hypothetical protein
MTDAAEYPADLVSSGSKDRVEALSGRLSVQTVPGAGTCVQVELPLDPRPARKDAAVPPAILQIPVATQWAPTRVVVDPHGGKGLGHCPPSRQWVRISAR